MIEVFVVHSIQKCSENNRNTLQHVQKNWVLSKSWNYAWGIWPSTTCKEPWKDDDMYVKMRSADSSSKQILQFHCGQLFLSIMFIKKFQVAEKMKHEIIILIILIFVELSILQIRIFNYQYMCCTNNNYLLFNSQIIIYII